MSFVSLFCGRAVDKMFVLKKPSKSIVFGDLSLVACANFEGLYITFGTNIVIITILPWTD